MRNKKIIIMIVITLFALIAFVPKVNAAVQVKAGTSHQNNITMNTAFQYCYDMRYQSSTLGNNSLDPHLSTERDWGAVAYLSLSSYGTLRSQKGDTVSIDSRNYYSTTGNISGVLNFGSDPTVSGDQATLVAAYRSDRMNNSNSSILWDSRYSKYVDILGGGAWDAINVGRALGETSGWYSSNTTYMAYTLVSRINGPLGYHNDSNTGTGNANQYCTYRPAIWN